MLCVLTILYVRLVLYHCDMLLGIIASLHNSWYNFCVHFNVVVIFFEIFVLLQNSKKLHAFVNLYCYMYSTCNTIHIGFLVMHARIHHWFKRMSKIYTKVS